MKTLDLDALHTAVAGGAAAFRARTRLQPADGPGAKTFPPTFAGAVYSVEKRRLPDRDEPVTCVLLDSVQSQANRMELALQEAIDRNEITMPIILVDFSNHGPTGNVQADREAGRLLDDLGVITSLQVPHRLADAILRDSELDGIPFRESEAGIGINKAGLRNATPVYQYCPTALVFGMWDSTGPKGGLGAKFERAMVSEVVGIGASFGLRTSSRIDPVITKTKGITIYEAKSGSWTLHENEARIDPKTKKPIKLGKDGKVSEANLGNVTPGFSKYTEGAEGPNPLVVEGYSPEARENKIAPAGVTLEYAEQLTTLSLIALRRLRFPENGVSSEERDVAGQTVLAALGLCSATLAFESGMGLRSRCLLWPDHPLEWELLAKPGNPPERFKLERSSALQLLAEATEAAKQAGLNWHEDPMRLEPSKQLLELVRKSQELAVKEGADKLAE